MGMYDDIKEFSKRCIRCQTGKAAARPRQGLLQLFPAHFPFQVLAYDIFGPLPITTSGFRAILVVCDKFTKWVELIPIPDQRAETIADALWEVVFSRYSFPEILLSDGARNVHNNALIKRLSERAGVSKVATSPYHAATDGQCERMNRFMAAILRVYTEQHAHSDWDKFLPGIAFAYRVTLMSSVGTSAFNLVFSRSPQLPSDIIYGPKSELEIDKKSNARGARLSTRGAGQN